MKALNVETIIKATDKFAKEMGWVPPPAEGPFSKKAIELSHLIAEGDFGCRAKYIRDIVAALLDEPLPSISEPSQVYTSLTRDVGDNVMLTLTTDYNSFKKDGVILVDGETRRHFSEICGALRHDGERTGYFDFCYLRPSTTEEIEAFVSDFNANREDNEKAQIDDEAAE